MHSINKVAKTLQSVQFVAERHNHYRARTRRIQSWQRFKRMAV